MTRLWPKPKPGKTPPSPVYPSYEEALKHSNGGYQSEVLAEVILEKTRRLRPETLNQNVAEEGLPFLLALARTGGTARVLDFGGAFGTHFLTALSIFPELKLRWAVVENPRFVEMAGAVSRENLQFFTSLEAAAAWLGEVDCLLSSSTLQYVSDPRATLQQLMALGARRIVWQRMVLSLGRSVIAIQTAPLSAHGPGPFPEGFEDGPVRTPITFYPEEEFRRAHADAGYRLCARFQSRERPPLEITEKTFSGAFFFEKAA